MQGGDFIHGFASGALGSYAASGWMKLYGGSGLSTIAFGALAGGVGAELTGGNFWQGAITGGVVAGLNHVMHSISQKAELKSRLEKELNALGYTSDDVAKMTPQQISELKNKLPLLNELFKNDGQDWAIKDGNKYLDGNEDSKYKIKISSEHLQNSNSNFVPKSNFLALAREFNIFPSAFSSFKTLSTTLAGIYHFASLTGILMDYI